VVVGSVRFTNGGEGGDRIAESKAEESDPEGDGQGELTSSLPP
jgi:hypothetical protein